MLTRVSTCPKMVRMRGATSTEPRGREYGANAVLEVATGRVDLQVGFNLEVELSQASWIDLYQCLHRLLSPLPGGMEH